MKSILALAAACCLLSFSARAGESPVVVELFTSQGCSSCPPADAYLHDLAAREGVIALALHVDYWDYIGWQDSFGQPAWSERQRDYARAAGRSMVYTPQMIVNGTDDVVGSRPKDTEALIAAHSAQPTVLDLHAVRSGNHLRIEGTALGDTTAQGSPFAVKLVRYMPRQDVQITRGENAGRTLSYTNIVTRIEDVGTWDGRGTLVLQTAMTGDQAGVILVQSTGSGAIISATEID